LIRKYSRKDFTLVAGGGWGVGRTDRGKRIENRVWESRDGRVSC